MQISNPNQVTYGQQQSIEVLNFMQDTTSELNNAQINRFTPDQNWPIDA